MAIIFFIWLGLAIGFLIGFLLDNVSKDKKNKKKLSNIKPGTVLKPKNENPFEDYEWKCETITEIRISDNGKVWIKSYTSNKNGVRAIDQQYSINRTGMRLFKDEWNIINQIDLEHEYNETR